MFCASRSLVCWRSESGQGLVLQDSLAPSAKRDCAKRQCLFLSLIGVSFRKFVEGGLNLTEILAFSGPPTIFVSYVCEDIFVWSNNTPV